MARLAGLASLASGLATLVCVYALPHLGLTSVTRSLLVGAAMALLVTGGRLLRASRSTGAAAPAGIAGSAPRVGSFDAPLEPRAPAEPVVTPTSPSRGSPPSGRRVSRLADSAALIVPAAIVVGAFLLLRPASADSTLRPVELPGLRLSLPAWHVGSSASEWFDGRHRIDDPAGAERFVEISWAVGEPMPEDTMRRFVVLPGMEVRSERAERVCGQVAHTLQLDAIDGGKESWFTWWHAEGRNDSLLSFVHSETGNVRKVHEAILASFRCLPAPAEVGRPAFPVVDTPAGFTRSESPDTLVLEAQDGATLLLPVGQAGRQFRDGFVRATTVRQRVLATFLDLHDDAVSLESVGRSQITADGTTQDLWRGDARPPGQPRSVALVAVWVCPAPLCGR